MPADEISWLAELRSDPADATAERPPTATDATAPVSPTPPTSRPAPVSPPAAAVRTPSPPRLAPPRQAPPSVFTRPARRRVRNQRGRLLFAALFWLGMVAVLVPFWRDTGALHGSGAVLTAAGRVTGLVGGYVLLFQVLLMSRLNVLERWIGAKGLLLWHRELGGAVVVMVIAHAVLITIGYADLDQVGLVSETRTLLTGYEDMVAAFVATGLLAGLGLLGIRALRRALSYETWYMLHLTSYLALFLGYGHQFADGQEMSSPGFGRYFWIGLYLLVVVAVAWGRVLAPVLLNLRHRLRVARVVEEAPGMISLYITGRYLDEIDAKAGQFFRWRFLARGCWTQSHPFSLSAAPNERWLRLTIKIIGDHTRQLRELNPGTPVLASGPAGDFTADRRTRRRALLIAGGSGIAPIRAVLEELPPGAIVLYRARNLDEIVFRRELEWLAEARGAEIRYVLGSRDEPEPRRLFTPDGMRAMVPDVRNRDVYLCGPPGLIDVSVRTLRRLKVRRKQIHLDVFEF